MVINQLIAVLSSYLTRCIYVGEYCINAYLVLLGVGLVIISVISLSIRKWAEPISNTILQDDDFNDLNRIWSRRGLQYWARHIKLLWTLRFRWLKSWIALRLYSAHPTIVKGIVAVGISSAAYSKSPQSPVIAAATAFYATMIFLQSAFEYAAVWIQSISVTRIDYNGVTDSLGVATEVENLGVETAEDIEAKLRIIDAPRGLTGSTTPDRRRNDSNPRMLESKHTKSYSFTFAGKRDSVGNIRDRAAINRELGEIAFAVVEIQISNQPVETIRYRNISDVDTQSEEELQDLMQGLAENLSLITEFTRRKYANEDVDEDGNSGAGDDAEGDEAGDDINDRDTNQEPDADDRPEEETEVEGTEDTS